MFFSVPLCLCVSVPLCLCGYLSSRWFRRLGLDPVEEVGVAGDDRQRDDARALVAVQLLDAGDEGVDVLAVPTKKVMRPVASKSSTTA